MQTFSPRDLARAVGVSESSVRRWIDRGSIRSRRTSGGHRRVSLPDAIEYLRGAGLPLREPAALGFDARSATNGDDSATVFEALRRGAEAELNALVTGAYLRGRSAWDLCDNWLRPALARIGEGWNGEGWNGGAHGVLVAHRAMAITFGTLHRLRALLPETCGPCALGGAVVGDRSRLSSLMAAFVLQAEGYDAVDLGADNEAAVLREAIRTAGPSIVWLSVDHAADFARVRDDVQRLLEETGTTTVALGGRYAAALELAPRPHLHVLSSLHELAALGRRVRGVKTAAAS